MAAGAALEIRAEVTPDAPDVLGVLRTLELLASDRYYGVEQRFSHVADFGYSKTPEETFQKWQGHEVALGDMVRVIRTFRPDVLIARFSGTERDGHGHHQASGILTPKAYALLCYMVEQGHRALSRTEILQHLWPATFVSEGALTSVVKELRIATASRTSRS